MLKVFPEKELKLCPEKLQKLMNDKIGSEGHAGGQTDEAGTI